MQRGITFRLCSFWYLPASVFSSVVLPAQNVHHAFAPSPDASIARTKECSMGI